MTVPKPSKMQTRLASTVEERKIRDAIESVSGGKIVANDFWDQAENLYQISINGIRQTHGLLVDHIKHIIADPEEKKKINDPMGLVANINLLTKDIQQHVNTLNAIHDDHKYKTGGSKDADDHMALLMINGRYSDALEMYNTVIMPTVTHIFEQINITNDLISQQIIDTLAKEEAAKADPNVITDVYVKETKKD